MAALRQRVQHALPFVLAGAATALLVAAFVVGTPPDEEEFRFAVLAAWLRVSALVRGDLPFWTSTLGFGVPQPFVPNFGLHPLLPLLAAAPPATWMRLVLVVHALVGATGLWFVGRHLQFTPAVRAVCVVTYLLASPVQNYVLTDFWPSHFLVWTSIPWVLLLAWRVLERDGPHVWRSAIALGLVGGLSVANTNPGHAGVHAVLAVAMVAAYRPRHARQWSALTVALVVALLVAMPGVVQLAREKPLFASDLGLSNLPDPLPLRGSEGSRGFFVGAPFMILAAFGLVWFARARLELVFGAALASLLLFSSAVPVPWVSARYQFRDPLTLCIILLAGLAASRLARAGTARRATAGVLLALQVIVVTSTAWPYLARTWGPEGLRAASFNGATGATPLVDRLANDTRTGGRLLFSPRVDHVVAERGLVDDGIGINALAYRGIAVVNGSFKGIATDPLWPNDRLFYGWIRTPPQLFASDAALDVLGIRYVLAFNDEKVPAGLRARAAYTTIRGAELTLFENPDAWPGAFLIDPAKLRADLPVHAGCPHDRLLCRDVGLLAGEREPTDVVVERQGSAIEVNWESIDEPRVLVLTEMYRPEWRVTSPQATLAPRVLYGGLLGVALPARVSSVRFEYRPTTLMTATALSLATIVLALAALALIAPRPIAPPSASADTSRSL